MNPDRGVLQLIGLALLCVSLVACAVEGPADPQPPQAPAPAAPAQPPVAAPNVPRSAPAQPQPAAPAATPVAAALSSQATGATIAAPVAVGRQRRGSTGPTPIPAVFPVSVQAGDDREITFDSPPGRIVAFDSAVVEILFAIGEGDRLVGTHEYVSYPPEVSDIPRVGDAFNMDIEAIVALEPDLVYVFYDRFVEDLERTGLKVLYIPTLSAGFDQIPDVIRMWGGIVGNPGTAEIVASNFETRVAAVRETMAPIGAGPVIFQDVGGLWTPGRGTMMQEVFDLLELENVGSDIDGYAQISPEVIVDRDPTLIITSDPTAFTDDAAFASVRAVRQNGLLTLSSDAFSVQGPRFIDAIEELARLVYPGVFR